MHRYSTLLAAQRLRWSRYLCRLPTSGHVFPSANGLSRHRFHFDRLHKFKPDIQNQYDAPLQTPHLNFVESSYKNVKDLEQDIHTVLSARIPLKTIEREAKKYLAKKYEQVQAREPLDELEKFRIETQKRQLKRVLNGYRLDIYNAAQVFSHHFFSIFHTHPPTHPLIQSLLVRTPVLNSL
jgi:hypothetical protein